MGEQRKVEFLRRNSLLEFDGACNILYLMIFRCHRLISRICIQYALILYVTIHSDNTKCRLSHNMKTCQAYKIPSCINLPTSSNSGYFIVISSLTTQAQTISFKKSVAEHIIILMEKSNCVHTLQDIRFLDFHPFRKQQNDSFR